MNTDSPAPCDYSPPEDLDALQGEIAVLSAYINAATYRLLRCIRALDEREAYAAEGFRSTAHWLSTRFRAAKPHGNGAKRLHS